MDRTIQVFIALFVLATVATAAGWPSIDHGKELFNSNLLGTNGRSCSTCHPDGKGLEEAADYDDKALAKIVNRCIVKSLNGKAVDAGSPDLTSLIMYLKTLGPAKVK